MIKKRTKWSVCPECKGKLIHIEYNLYYCNDCNKDWFYNEEKKKFVPMIKEE